MCLSTLFTLYIFKLFQSFASRCCKYAEQNLCQSEFYEIFFISSISTHTNLFINYSYFLHIGFYVFDLHPKYPSLWCRTVNWQLCDVVLMWAGKLWKSVLSQAEMQVLTLRIYFSDVKPEVYFKYYIRGPHCIWHHCNIYWNDLALTGPKCHKYKFLFDVVGLSCLQGLTRSTITKD